MKDWDVDKVIKVMAAAVILIVFMVNALASHYHVIPDNNKEAAGRTSATIENIILLLTGYYFGSSLSASRLRDQISKVMDNTIPLDADTQKTVTTTTKT